MKKRAKLIGAVVSLIAIACMSVGCNSGRKVVVGPNATLTPDEPMETMDVTEIVTETKEPGEQEEQEQSTDITIEKQVVFENGDYKITAEEYIYDEYSGEVIKFLFENNTSKDVKFSIAGMSVNNYMAGDLLYCDVAAGKKAYDEVALSSEALKQLGVGNVGLVEIYFEVLDKETYDNLLVTDCITIKTSEYDNMITEPVDDGTELYNKGGVRIVGKGVYENSYGDVEVVLFCENKTGKIISIDAEDVSVNGFMIDAYLMTDLFDGKMSLPSVTIDKEDLEDNSIDKIEEVEFKFEISEVGTFDVIDESDVISFKVK